MKIIFATLMCAVCASTAFGAADSVRVVKGQVSDYYIPVSDVRVVRGTVRDTAGKPLEGATVMWKASPAHCNTDAAGRYALRGGAHECSLYVYAPGMAFADTVISPDSLLVDIVMRPDTLSHACARGRAQVTPWYDPYDDRPSTFCNPLNIAYNYIPYQKVPTATGHFRSTADPMALTFKGEYYLFSTNQNGLYYSDDLSRWTFAPASFKTHPTDDDQCAPAAFVSGDTIFFTGSTYEGLPVWYTTQPKEGRWRKAMERGTLPWWDPYMFLDDDGRLYLYYGSSNEYPLKAVELRRADFTPISRIHDVMALHPELHGWERFGMNNDDSTTLKPFTEGAYMTKHDGRYYLQYGAPGTEFKIYADGVYVSDSPLGPFTYQTHNPMSYKPGGYVRGSGHGGTFADVSGNYWHTSTCMLSNKYKFERRIGLYPTAFDPDGVMYSWSALGDYPMLNARHDVKKPSDRWAGWMLLSLGKPVTASSDHDAAALPSSNITDENMRTYWAAATGDPGEWIAVDLGAPKQIRALQPNYYDCLGEQWDRANDRYHAYRIYASLDGRDWQLAVDKSDNDIDCPHDYVELRQPLEARYVKMESLHVPSGLFCLSDLRVFGLDTAMESPATPEGLRVARDHADPRNAPASWRPVPGAYGYNLYYGTATDKFYNAITVYGGDTSYDMRGLDAATPYYWAVEALGEGGRSPLSRPLLTKAK